MPSPAAIAIGARVTHCAAGVGAVITQHRTDPRLGPRGLELLRAGRSAQQTIDALVAATPHIQWRQLAALDAAGSAATYSGARTRPEMSEVAAQDACAVGNNLVNARATPAMLLAFLADPTAPLAERLVVRRGSRPGRRRGARTGAQRAPAGDTSSTVFR